MFITDAQNNRVVHGTSFTAGLKNMQYFSVQMMKTSGGKTDASCDQIAHIGNYGINYMFCCPLTFLTNPKGIVMGTQALKRHNQFIRFYMYSRFYMYG